MSPAALLLLLGAGVLGAARGARLTVYLTSGCEDSRRFVVERLAPFRALHSARLGVDFVAWGRSRWNASAARIDCQFGDADCRGNAVQRCALAFIPDESERMAYMACEYATLSGSAGRLDCIADPVVAADVARCTSDLDLSTRLASDAASATPTRLAFVPSLALDGAPYEAGASQRLYDDLPAEMCASDSQFCL